jgi:hypothetical protein
LPAEAEVLQTSYLSRAQSKNRRRISDLPRQRASTLPHFETIYVRALVRRRNKQCNFLKDLEAPPGFEPGMEVLQTSALPLGDGADRKTD